MDAETFRIIDWVEALQSKQDPVRLISYEDIDHWAWLTKPMLRQWLIRACSGLSVGPARCVDEPWLDAVVSRQDVVSAVHGADGMYADMVKNVREILAEEASLSHDELQELTHGCVEAFFNFVLDTLADAGWAAAHPDVTEGR